MNFAAADGAIDLIGIYRDLHAADPRQPGIVAAYATALLEGGDPEAACAIAGAATDTADPGVFLVHARALRALGKFEPAVQGFAAAISAGATGAPVLVALGNCLAELGRLEEATTWFARAAPDDPSGRALANLASARARLGQNALAIDAARAALRCSPELIDAHRTLAVLLAGSEPESAAAHREVAFRNGPVFVRPGPQDALRVLVLTCLAEASLPIEHLLPNARYALTDWFIDHPVNHLPHLPPHDLVFNAIGEAELMPPLDGATIGFLAGGLPVMNRPEAVMRTGRTSLPALLAGIDGLVVPPVLRVAAGEIPVSIGLPALVRPVGTHGGHGLRRVETAEQLTAASHEAGDKYLSRFIDYRSDDGYYRKYRMIFVDRQVYPYHLAIGPHWMVHYWTAGMDLDPARRAEEARFLDDPVTVLGSAAFEAVSAVGRRLDLDYAGIDFSILPDGRVLVFEANAAMLVHPEREAEFAYRNQAVQRILDAFADMLERRAGRGDHRAPAGDPAEVTQRPRSLAR
ncbi:MULTISPECIES: hypothetical protein [unclassified Acidiphilium]|uniref:hypothetical protein n=1 Tax=unclassified Acidiphilium TaxID=2617493 RepID=UPI001F27A94D|nr:MULTISPECIES: hypothetical protein [unclassified Acidiphilium]